MTETLTTTLDADREAKRLAAKKEVLRWRKDALYASRKLFNFEPDPAQVDLLQAFSDQDKQRIALKACKGPGKAQPIEIVIESPKGQRTLGDLAVGDYVFASDGTPTRICAVHDRGVLPVYRVAFDDGSSTLACGEHLWVVKGRTERRHDRWAILSTDQIIQRGVREKNGRWAGRHFEIPRQEAAQFDVQELPLDPYVLGVWLGDGIRLKCAYATKPEPHIAEEIRLRGYKISPVHDGLVSIYGVTKHLKALQVFHCYSSQRFIPESYKRVGVAQRTDLVCGLMDTDGSIGDDGHMEYSTTSKQLAEDLVWLVRSLGGVAYLKGTIKKPFYYSPERTKIYGKDCYRVTLVLPFNPFRVPHRRARWKSPYRSASTVRYMTRKIDAIEREGEAECRCIQVEHETQTYLTNDFIVTHNTAGLAVCMWIFAASRPHPKIAATSISGDNLQDNLWTELSKWQQRSPYLLKKFEWQKTRIVSRDHPETWWMSARTWAKTADAEKMGGTLAGLHADYTLAVLDESGGIPDAVMATADASLSTVGGEHRVIQAGNPTHTEGPLYRACTNERHLWHVIEITGDPDDPKRSPRISLKWAKEQIEKYGRDNPWVLVNVFGKFPPASINQLLGPDDVSEAMQRWHHETVYSHEAKILGIDPGRFGGARSVIFPRQGLQGFTPVVLRPNRNQRDWTGAFSGRIVAAHNKWNSDAQFIDETGGWGSGILDACVVGGLPIIGINFSSNAIDRRYLNRRAEMYFKAADWVKKGGALPNIPELVREATATTYTFRKGAFVVEEKDQVQEKLNGESPDLWDAFVLTFAQEVVAKTGIPWLDNKHAHAKTDPDEDDYARRTGRAVMEEE